MTHELRTPLNAIIGFSEIIAERAAADRRHPGLRQIHPRVGHAAARHAQRRARPGADRGRPARARRAGRRRSRRCSTRAIRPVREAAEAQIDRDHARHAGSSTCVWLDPGKMKQVFDQPAVERDQVHPARAAAIEIDADLIAGRRSGRCRSATPACGIPADDLERVLEPFGQVEDHLTRRERRRRPRPADRPRDDPACMAAS